MNGFIGLDVTETWHHGVFIFKLKNHDLRQMIREAMKKNSDKDLATLEAF